MDEDGAVFKSLGGGDINIGHVAAVELAFVLLHLIPLVVLPLRWVDFTKSLHGQEEDQFKVWHAPAQRTPFQGRDETLAG